MKLHELNQSSTEELQQEIKDSYLHTWNQMKDDVDAAEYPQKSDLEILNSTILVLIDILKEKNVDVSSEALIRLSGYDEKYDIHLDVIYDIIMNRVNGN